MHALSKRLRVPLCLAFLWAICLASFFAAAQTINYTYDEAGRLKSVTNTANETAEYVYDAAGNLTQIRRTAANVPAVTDFRPDSGPIGTVVTISGANFNATPANNTVRFNGTAASVSSASTTQLVATVPAGATTGPVSVQTSAGTGTSLQTFTVTAAGIGAPTISGVSPGIGLPGTAVTITGTNFATAPGQTKVYFNQSLAAIQSITSGSITATVPQATGTGKIRVVTLAGTATSTIDFVIPGPNASYYAISEYSGQLTRLTLGGSGSLNISPPTNTIRWGLYVFDGGPDTAVSLDFTTFSTAPGGQTIWWEVRNLRNEMMTGSAYEDGSGNANLSANKRSIHIPPMPLNGTYAVFLRVNGYSMTSMSSTAQLRADPELAIDGTSTAFSTTFTGQTLRQVFRGVQASPLGYALQGLTITPSNWSAYTAVGFRQPDWNTVKGLDGINPVAGSCQQASVPTGGCGVNLLPLPQTGFYSAIIYPSYVAGTTAASGSTWLSNDLTGNLTIGTNFDTSTHRVGQNGRYKFSGTTNQLVGLTVSNVTFAPTDPYNAAYVKLIRSNGSDVPSSNFNVKAGAGNVTSFEFPALPANDTYTVFLDPDSAAGGTARLRLWSTVTGTLAVNGSALPVALTQGQKARITFTATAGQNLGLGLSGLAHSPGDPNPTGVYVYRESDNANMGSVNCTTSNPGGRCGLNFANLNAGNYRIEIVPPAGPTSTNLSLTLSTDLTGTLTTNTTTSVNLSRVGQNGRYTFTGTTGQHLGLAVSALALQDSQWVQVSVLRSNGTVVVSPTNIAPPTGVIDLPALPANDTYTVFLDPLHASSGTLDVTLSTDVTGTLTINGSAQNAALTVRGQTARYSFTVATAGQNLGLGLSALALTPSTGGTIMKVVNPGGADILSVSCDPSVAGSGCMLNASGLATGTYTVVVTPPSATTAASFTLTLSTDVTTALTLATPYNLSVARRGQDARLTFPNTAGQNRRITITSLATTPSGQNVTVRVLRPSDGAVSYIQDFSGTGGTLDMPALAQTGNYTIWFDQGLGLTYTLTINVTQY